MNRTVLFLLNSPDPPSIEEVVDGIDFIKARRIGILLHRPIWIQNNGKLNKYGYSLAKYLANIPGVWLGLHWSPFGPNRRTKIKSLKRMKRAARKFNRLGNLRFAYADSVETLYPPKDSTQSLPENRMIVTRIVNDYLNSIYKTSPTIRFCGCSDNVAGWSLMTEFGPRDQHDESLSDFCYRVINYLIIGVNEGFIPSWSTVRKSVGWLKADRPDSLNSIFSCYEKINSWRRSDNKVRWGGLVWQLHLNSFQNSGLKDVLNKAELMLSEWDSK